MKIAIISDIHGNIFALKAVMNEIDRLNIKKIVFLGDAIGYYYHPNEVYELLFEREAEIVLGNHEEMLIYAYNNPHDLDFRNRVLHKYGSGLLIALRELTHSTIEKLIEFPNSKQLAYGNSKIFVCHGSPLSKDEYIYPTSSIEKLAQCEIHNIDLVCLGHTHYPFVWRGNLSIVANVGSVGQSRVQGGVADWAVWDTIEKEFFPMKTFYDTEELKKLVLKIDPTINYNYNILSREINERF
jgi:putative phosphoesterase